MTGTTHFGFEDVPVEEKQQRVAQVFSSVASKYDLMNDVMSMGMHRLWKPFAVAASGAKKGHSVLDLAGGTGDIAALLAKRVGAEGEITLADINGEMLNVGRDRLTNKGLFSNINYVQANAETLPFPENSFDVVTIAFGLRNVTHKDQALASIYRSLKPGGKLMILEFSKLVIPTLDKLYEQYSFKLIPEFGKLLTGDRDSYQYLVESIRKHPDQETLVGMMADAGFEMNTYNNLTGGIVAVHRGVKL
ncbi:MAG: bifunctional demethylmenaquinone methyltransferase/2-methoxy-6-polyprenyl-1,4-benzoquinol methylase UbiE [Gammaproteobacteria bacterium]